MSGIPKDFSSRRLSIRYVNASSLLRIYRNKNPDALHFSTRATNRFDSINGRFGVMYAAFDLTTCFAETITREQNRAPFLGGGITVSRSAEIATRSVASLASDVELRLADATDIGLYSIGADSSSFAHRMYARYTQPWAEVLYDRPELIDGILYKSRFLNDRLAVAIFDRSRSKLNLLASSITPLHAHRDFATVLSSLQVHLLA